MYWELRSVSPLFCSHFRSISLVGGPATAVSADPHCWSDVQSGWSRAALSASCSCCRVREHRPVAVDGVGVWSSQARQASVCEPRPLLCLVPSAWCIAVSACGAVLSAYGQPHQRLRPAAMLIVGIVTCVRSSQSQSQSGRHHRFSSSTSYLSGRATAQSACAGRSDGRGRRRPEFEGDYVYDAGGQFCCRSLGGGVCIISMSSYDSLPQRHSAACLSCRGMVSVVCSTVRTS